MSAPFLHTAAGAYDLRAIMGRAWIRARNTVATLAKAGMVTTIREAFADALRQTWDEARSARSVTAWKAEQDRQAEALATMDERTRRIVALRAGRLAAEGIESGPRYLAEIYAIDACLAQLGA